MLKQYCTLGKQRAESNQGAKGIKQLSDIARTPPHQPRSKVHCRIYARARWCRPTTHAPHLANYSRQHHPQGLTPRCTPGHHSQQTQIRVMFLGIAKPTLYTRGKRRAKTARSRRNQQTERHRPHTSAPTWKQGVLLYIRLYAVASTSDARRTRVTPSQDTTPSGAPGTVPATDKKRQNMP